MEFTSLATAPLTADRAAAYAERLKVVADPTRLQILSLLASQGHRPVSAGDLAEPLNVAQPTASHHLKKLVEAGLLTRRKAGRNVFFTLRRHPFREMCAVLNLDCFGCGESGLDCHPA